MKRVVSLILSVVMLFSITTAVDFSASASQGENVNDPYIMTVGQTTVGGFDKETNHTVFYKFELEQSGLLVLDFKTEIDSVEFKIYDCNVKNCFDEKEMYINSNYGRIQENMQYFLESGTYYISIRNRYSKTGTFYIDSSFAPYSETFPENDITNNNTIDGANEIVFNKQYVGIKERNAMDFYKFNMPYKSKIKVTMNAKTTIEFMDINLYDVYGKEIDYRSFRSNNGILSGDESFVIDKGTYYLRIGSMKTVYRTDGIYNFKMSISCDHEYNRVYKAPTYFEKGYTQFTCKVCGYSYKKYVDKLQLNKPSIYSVTSGVKKLNVRLNANYYSYDGVQIQYSTNKKFSNAKTSSTKKASKTIKGLKKKKTYYLRVRSYKKVNGKKVYSKWSTVRKVKTK
ncbi:hypothetical protein [Eubacterium sp.]